MTDIKLNPCPFCGGSAILNDRFRPSVANRKMYWVSCRKCAVTQSCLYNSGYNSKKKAIEAWNRRADGDD